ncbi:HAMP domain-containing histidine kinase [Mucilaginibacter achroorhodeus]|uniref:histidine kinase n=1 Tax=Mucilaginibacter achroorhodeus TaxID=2599294 RepID=A0A563TWK3_9SPHI|nr:MULTISPECIES: HAMP domain-containing sensor histidine kinase [Mucilaginibacter]QXV65739.1 HAMP domain-containing histidine kinase [Mucilaginibacter sp. 21P]TWR23724.1 HAMP domain-containing histidine kinase [Mucilaginibacter achroorhodeus]
MKKKSIALIIGLMGFALLGVVAMQLYFLRQSYQMQSELFNQSVNEALNSVVNKVSKQDAINFINAKTQHTFAVTISDKKNDISINGQKISARDSVTSLKQSKRQRKLAMLRDSLRRMILHKKQDDEINALMQQGSVNLRIRIEEYTDEFGDVHGRFIPEIVKGPKPAKRKLHKYDTLYATYIDPQFGKQLIAAPQLNPLWVREQQRLQKERQLAQIRKMLEADSLANMPNKGKTANVIENIAEEYRKSDEPLYKRLNVFWIDSLLRFELHNRGIFLPFSYEVAMANKDSLIFSKAMDMSGEKPQFIPANTYQKTIFNNELLTDPGKLRVYFPQKDSLILGNMKATMGTTAGLLMVLIFCFGYTIFSIIKQKKVSEMKIDFINNMTHEFKTPVSTIMIASEALKDDEIAQDKSRVSRLANVIYEENLRLGSHIERVLNIARIEKNDFKLDKKPVDVNDMISVVLDSMALKLQKHEAITKLNLDAENPVIMADELHLSNVLYNLIDNAVKYSKDVPEITISTYNKNNELVIKVADKGIGMSRDQQSKIFEQFYRIPTGNLHDVKGFGLGLSYVNTIVKRLEGAISVRSEKEKGSEFELKFAAV